MARTKTSPSWTPVGAALLLLLVALSARAVSASGVFELGFDQFRNERGVDAKGQCCRGVRSSASASCSEPCPTQFRVCLKHYQTSIDVTGPCTYGDFSTPVLGRNSFDLDAADAAGADRHNGYMVRLPFEFSWPVRARLCLDVDSVLFNVS